MDYPKYVKMLKAMADSNRLQIIDLLSCGSLCACDILTHFEFTQPTLSHHMKVLQSAGIVSAKKDGKWQRYSLEPHFIRDFQTNTGDLLTGSQHCICQSQTNLSCDECQPTEDIKAK